MLLLISLYRIISRCVSKDYILDSTTDSQYGECSLDSLTKELLNSSQEGNNVDCPEVRFVYCKETYLLCFNSLVLGDLYWSAIFQARFT